MIDAQDADFMERHFGEHAAACRAAFLDAGREAHVRSLDAKQASRLKTNHAYGSTFWVALPQEVVGRLLEVLPGAVSFAPRGAQYDLLAWEGIAVLAVKVLEDGGHRAGIFRARVSDLRTRLTRVNGPARREPTLFDGEDGLSLDSAGLEPHKIAEAACAALGNVATKMVIAAYACSAASGLQAVRVGIGTLAADGTIDFLDSESLSVLEKVEAASAPRLVTGPSFSDAPRPRPILHVVEEGKVATGEPQRDDDHGGSDAE